MTERTRLSPSLLNLITDFEQSLSDGIDTALDERAYAQIVEYYEEENRLDRALEVVNRAINHHKSNLDFLIQKIDLLIKSRRFDDVYNVIMDAMLSEPFNVDLSVKKAIVLAHQKKLDEAFELVEDLKSYVSKQHEVKVHLAEAEICEMSRDFDQMFQSLKLALILEPENLSALKFIKRAVNSSRQNCEESILIHSVIIENHPYCAQAWYNLGHAFALVEEYQNAVEALEYAFLVKRDFEEAYYDCAEFCMEIGEFQRAEIILNEALLEFDPHYDTLYNLALCQYETDHIDEAKRTLFEAMQVEPYCEELHFLMAKCDIKNENWIGAINMLESAIDLEDQIEDYYYHLGLVYEKLNKSAKANVFYRKAAFKGEEQSFYWEQYIKFLIKKGNHQIVEKYISISSEHTYSSKLRYLEAANYLIAGRKKEGMDLLEDLLIEDFDAKEILNDVDVDILSNKDIQSLISYYEKE